MQINKQLIAIIILASLLFSAIGAALFFFKKNQQTQKAKSELVTIFIAKEDIQKDTLLTIENLAQTTIAKEFILERNSCSKSYKCPINSGVISSA